MRPVSSAVCTALAAWLALAGADAHSGGKTVLARDDARSLGDLLFGAGARTREPVPPERAFTLSASVDAHVLALHFDVHDCCYLYQDKLRFRILNPHGHPAAGGPRLGKVRLPPGERTRDAYFGESVVYRGKLEVTVPLLELPANAAFALEMTYQGCSEQGVVLCYEPLKRRIWLRSTGTGLVVESLDPPHPAS